jgi:hypothetical protein
MLFLNMVCLTVALAPSLLKKPMGFLPEYDVKSFLPQTESKSDNLPHQVSSMIRGTMLRNDITN